MDGEAPQTAPSVEAVTASGRKRRVRTARRSKTYSIRDVRARARVENATDAAQQLVRETLDLVRPTTRAECRDGVRPCPWVGCRQHLYLNVTESGSLQITWPDLEPDELKETCALDIAERGGITLEETGVVMNLTRERIRQVETRGLFKIKMETKLGSEDLKDH